MLTSISRSDRTWDVRAEDPSRAAWLQHHQNKVLWPLSASGWAEWHEKPLEDIREALWEKAVSVERMRKGIVRAQTAEFKPTHEKGASSTVKRKISDDQTTEDTKATGVEAC